MKEITGSRTIRPSKRQEKLKVISNVAPKPIFTGKKTSFEPISNPDIVILILGSMPGDRSLELGEYYGHARNRFWKVIATITGNDLPLTYPDKKLLLSKTGIGLWDVVHKANRKGSLDSAIENEEPNDLDDFIARHNNIKTIGFNGAKSEAIFNRYFERKAHIRYFSLPSTSPANAGMNFDNICKAWLKLFAK